MTVNCSEGRLLEKAQLADFYERVRGAGKRLVFTNGCFDVLHAGHIELLTFAKEQGDVLIVGINSDASVRRLKGNSRPINDQLSRAKVLLALRAVDAVVIFDEDTPIATLEKVRPAVHVKGGDYNADNLPETATVRRYGGEIRIVPLLEGFSTTRIMAKSTFGEGSARNFSRSVLVIPARYGSSRFPGKPLALLGGEPVIVHVVRAGLQTQIERPVLVATDNEEIASVIKSTFAAEDALVVMTESSCTTGTERVAQAVQRHFGDTNLADLLVLNVQGDEPFINPVHLDALLETMRQYGHSMGTLVTPLRAADTNDPNVVKAVVDQHNRALYFSRLGIPCDREGDKSTFTRLRHVGVYAYRGEWLVKMATLAPTPLEEMEMLEQLRALENGVAIAVARVEDVVPIAIDTPHDLGRAQEYLAGVRAENEQRAGTN